MLNAEPTTLTVLGGTFFGGVALLNNNIEKSLKKDVESVRKDVESTAADIRTGFVFVSFLIIAAVGILMITRA